MWALPLPIFVTILNVVLRHLHGSCCINHMLCLMIGWEPTLCRIYQFSGALKYTCIEKIKNKTFATSLRIFRRQMGIHKREEYKPQVPLYPPLKRSHPNCTHQSGLLSPPQCRWAVVIPP